MGSHTHAVRLPLLTNSGIASPRALNQRGHSASPLIVVGAAVQAAAAWSGARNGRRGGGAAASQRGGGGLHPRVGVIVRSGQRHDVGRYVVSPVVNGVDGRAAVQAVAAWSGARVGRRNGGAAAFGRGGGGLHPRVGVNVRSGQSHDVGRPVIRPVVKSVDGHTAAVASVRPPSSPTPQRPTVPDEGTSVERYLLQLPEGVRPRAVMSHTTSLLDGRTNIVVAVVVGVARPRGSVPLLPQGPRGQGRLRSG